MLFEWMAEQALDFLADI
jgi:hypothetical protein